MGRAALAVLVAAAVALPHSGREGGVLPNASRWCASAQGRGVPAADSTTVYFLTRRHEVMAVDAGTGRLRWTSRTGAAGEGTMGSTVLLAGNRVVVGDDAVMGFDAATGAKRWQFEPSDGYGAGMYLGSVLDGTVFGGSPSGRLYAIAAQDGTRLWSTAPIAQPRTTIFNPTADGGMVAAGYSTFSGRVVGGVVVVEAASGTVRWRREFPAAGAGESTAFAGGPVVMGGIVIAASSDGRIHAYDERTGVSRWTAPPVERADGRVQRQDWRALARTGEILAAGSFSGVLSGLDPASGRERWRWLHAAAGSIGIGITADDERVYVPHFGGLLVAVSSRDGRQQWETGGFDDGFTWAPVVSGAYVYAAGSNAGLCAFPR